MKGSTPKTRARSLNKELKRIYDPHGKRENVVDMLTDLRHLCDAQELDFADCDRSAYDHYRTENYNQHISKEKAVKS